MRRDVDLVVLPRLGEGQGKDGPPSQAAVGAWEYDFRTGELSWTDGVYDLFGLRRRVPVQRAAIVQMYHDGCREKMEALRAQAIRQGGGFTLDARIWTESGAMRWMRLTAGVAMGDGHAVRIFGSKQDITQEREAWERLRQRADRDALTGLPNRAVFEALCHEMRQGRQRDAAGLAIIDLDHFKLINDGYGHAAGDACLRVVAERLRRIFAGALLVARFAGDEFVVLCRGPLSRAEVRLMFRHAVTALSEPVPWDGRLIDMGVSVGVAARLAGQGPDQLFAEADIALYRAKAVGRGTVCFHGEAPGEMPGQCPPGRGWYR